MPGLFLCAALAPKAFVQPSCGSVCGLDGRGDDSQKTKSRQDAHRNCRKKNPKFHDPATVAIWVYRNQTNGALLSKTGERSSCANTVVSSTLASQQSVPLLRISVRNEIGGKLHGDLAGPAVAHRSFADLGDRNNLGCSARRKTLITDV